MVRIPVRGGVDLAAVIADVASSFSRGCGENTVAKARNTHFGHTCALMLAGQAKYAASRSSQLGLSHAGYWHPAVLGYF